MTRTDRTTTDAALAFLDGAARAVSDTVLYEGYLLYPYRPDALKNRHPWQFGVLMPPAFAAEGSGEHSSAHTEFLLDGRADTLLRVGVRWLSGGVRRGEGATGFEVRISDLLAATLARWELGSDDPSAPAAPADTRPPARRGEVVLDAQPLPGPFGGFRIRATIRNTSTVAPPATGIPDMDERNEALAAAFVGAQLIAQTRGGHVLSLADPPEWAADAARACVNERLWPALLAPADTVLADTVLADTVLAAPIILPDRPCVAAESPAPFCDATEIDEMLALRTSTLTEAEQRAAREADPRAADLLDAVAELAPAMIEKLHGRTTVTAPRTVTHDPALPACLTPGSAVRIRPGGHPAAAAGADGADGAVTPAGPAVAGGSRGVRRTDAQDMFVDGAAATVATVLHDVDGQIHVAVTLDDDPGADLRREFGRFLYFTPDELEAL